MRKLFALSLMTFSLVCSSAFAQEQETEAAPGSLKHHMKEAGRLFKAIGGTVKDSSKNAENADAAGQISALFKLAKEQTPDSFADIPEAHRAEALQSYQEMIQKEIDLADQLQQAFLNNDNAAAADLYQKMKDLKQDGHDRFDP